MPMDGYNLRFCCNVMLQQNRDNNSTNNKERDQKNRIKELGFKDTCGQKVAE